MCTHILERPTPICCENCAGPPPHKFGIISAHFWMPLHIFRTNFLGLVGTGGGAFAQFSRAHGLFSKSASVQAINVSALEGSEGHGNVPKVMNFRVVSGCFQCVFQGIFQGVFLYALSGHHPGRNCYKRIPSNTVFCNNLCSYYKI